MLTAILLGANLFLAQGTFNADEYKCSICVASLEKASELGTVFQAGCQSYFPAHICEQIKIPTDKIDLQHKSARENCEAVDICPPDDTPDVSGNIDIRVSKALGSRGYDKVRISVISNRTVDSDLFSYKSQFQYRWTDKYLSTGIVSVTPGVSTNFKIGDQEVNIMLPAQGAGTRGVILADPCFSSQWIMCVYSQEFQMFNHSLELLNAINAHEDVSYWQVLGDNFYDQEGDLSASWTNGLSSQSKSKMFASTPGNHDFWVNSSPKVYVPHDQLGNGFMQFYGQDTLGASSTSPYDFSVNPDADSADKSENLPAASNYFFYNQVGNTGFVGTFAVLFCHRLFS
jgi:hypothetical protein